MGLKFKVNYLIVFGLQKNRTYTLFSHVKIFTKKQFDNIFIKVELYYYKGLITCICLSSN